MKSNIQLKKECKKKSHEYEYSEGHREQIKGDYYLCQINKALPWKLDQQKLNKDLNF